MMECEYRLLCFVAEVRSEAAACRLPEEWMTGICGIELSEVAPMLDAMEQKGWITRDRFLFPGNPFPRRWDLDVTETGVAAMINCEWSRCLQAVEERLG